MTTASLAPHVGPGDFNQLPLSERDIRWRLVREAMAERGIDCLLIAGNSARWNDMNANIRYVANYADPLSAECYALFPLEGDGMLITQMEPKRSAHALSWFADVRGLNMRDLAAPDMTAMAAGRIAALGLEAGTLGLVGNVLLEGVNIGMPWNRLEAMKARLPRMRFVDVTDMFFELRSVKTGAEIECLARSAELVDIGFEAHLRISRVGISERELHAGIVHAMECAGAEPPTILLLQTGPMPHSTLTQDPIPSGRKLGPGDVIISESSPKWAGYQAQGLQCIVLGDATREMRELAKHGAEAWHICADKVRPGNTPDQVAHAADRIIERAREHLGGLADGLRPICVGAGLGALDPHHAHREIVPGQAFMLEIGPGGRPFKPPQHVNGGVLVVSTAGDPRCFIGSHPMEERFLVELR